MDFNLPGRSRSPARSSRRTWRGATRDPSHDDNARDSSDSSDPDDSQFETPNEDTSGSDRFDTPNEKTPMTRMKKTLRSSLKQGKSRAGKALKRLTR